ncbi:hypothetical protein M501DRAFT_1054897 [Patellaria atrata CBS 101060]|uniref:Uncharacterized protein n=1 Tax=Patellaria atrata CBS 101060 TaxID=1346257 RepID=A0A9P4SI01_9PEZI|nr:hypothetical protein M501DRAFT_1054897 [Patellaria atrata CBS 101060]
MKMRTSVIFRSSVMIQYDPPLNTLHVTRNTRRSRVFTSQRAYGKMHATMRVPIVDAMLRAIKVSRTAGHEFTRNTARTKADEVVTTTLGATRGIFIYASETNEMESTDTIPAVGRGSLVPISFCVDANSLATVASGQIWSSLSSQLWTP